MQIKHISENLPNFWGFCSSFQNKFSKLTSSVFTELWKTGREGPWEITQPIQATCLNLSSYLVWFKQHPVIYYQGWITALLVCGKWSIHLWNLDSEVFLHQIPRKLYFCYSMQTSLKMVVLHSHLFKKFLPQINTGQQNCM